MSKGREWEEDFDQRFTYRGNYVYQVEIKDFIRELIDKAREEERTEIQNIISKRMMEYANTSLSKRPSAYEELYGLSVELSHLQEKGKE